MSFKQISDLLEVPVLQLQILNPSYKLDVIPFMVMKTIIWGCRKKIAVFASNEDKIYAYVQNELDLRENPFRKHRTRVSKNNQL
jgi:membrane-bound lytic murein transglycosylase D